MSRAAPQSSRSFRAFWLKVLSRYRQSIATNASAMFRHNSPSKPDPDLTSKTRIERPRAKRSAMERQRFALTSWSRAACLRASGAQKCV